MKLITTLSLLGFYAWALVSMASEPRPATFTGDMYRWAVAECGGPFKKMVMLETLEVELTCHDGTLHRYYAGHKQ